MLAALTVLVLAACGGDREIAEGPDPGPSTSVPDGSSDGDPMPEPTSPPLADGGWIGGEPDWALAVEGEYAAAGDAATVVGATAEAERAVPAAGEAVAEEALSDATLAVSVLPEGSPLRAGSVDDNADYPGYLAYLERIASLGVPLRELDATGRIVATVTGANGLPVAGATVTVTGDDGSSTSLVTTADGTTRFMPGLVGMAGSQSFTFDVGGVSATAAASDATVDLQLGAGGGASEIAVDVLFLLDATGSMGDEIDRLKSSIDAVADRVDALGAIDDLRLAMTIYRDEGDAFVTATHDFTSDVAAFRSALANVVADGGNDYPEALDEGLAEALAAPAWRPAGTALQFVFLVADAPPQVARQVPSPYPDSIRLAASRGIKIFPVASSESDDQAEAVFRQIAQATGARFVFLTYGAAGAATGASTDIAATDYEELALDDLVVRLIAEEVAALSGDDAAVPPPTPTTTTIPQGQ